ncbi:MAG: MFS transporter [Gemmatimonadota bacterium]|nr:MFS transporter [Gemmatimonadota bacterium]
MKKDTFLYINAFLMDCCFAIVGVCVPLHALQFGATYDDLGHINAWGALAYTLTSLVSGRLADRMGYRPVMTVGCVFLALAFVGYIGVYRIWHFILLSVLTAVAIAHYWPPMQAYLGRGKSRDMLLPALGRFNVAWTLGVFVGPAAGGVLFVFHPFSGFVLSGFFVFLLFLGLIVVPILESEPGVAATRSVVATSGHFFPLALLANFATFFVIGLIRALFPKLATDLGISPDLLGFLLALIALTQLVDFYLVRSSVVLLPSILMRDCPI